MYDDEKKNVILMGSMHHHKKRDDTLGQERKPDIITFYKSTKGGVDVVDMMMYKCKFSRNCGRWHPTFVFALLRFTCVNS